MPALFQNIDCVEFYVPDLDEGIKYYKDGMGLKLLWRTETSAGMGMESDIAEILLQIERKHMEVDIKVDSVIDSIDKIVNAGGKVKFGPFDIPIGKCAVILDKWDNEYVILDMTKGRYVTDENGNVTGVSAEKYASDIRSMMKGGIDMTEVLKYYCEPGMMTNLDKHKAFTDWLTADPGAIYQVAQGLLVHDLWVSLYGEAHVKAHEYPQKTAYMSDLLDMALALDGSSLAIPRHPRERVIACCREFATLMCALLRAKGIPARSRCGFAVYFDWNVTFEDHWICEYWNGARWVMADPQLDPFQQSTIIGWALKGEQNAETLSRLRQLNPRDLKPDEFLTAGQAWRLCREGKADPNKFGIGCPIRPEWGIDSLYGLWFIRGQLLRDFAALNKVETVPYLVRICKGLDWKPWRLVALKDSELTDEELSLLDHIADLTADADGNFDKIREAYLTNKELAVPVEIIAR